eukprot:gene2364-18003_t
MGSSYPWLNLEDTAILELLHKWEKEDAEGNRKPTEILKSLSEKVEEQYEQFLGLVPDPFDDRHPSQSYPDCKFGDTLRLIIGEKEFMHKLTTSYFANTDDDFELNCQAARLLLNILSGMEGKIFEDWESVGKICYKWGKAGKEPLRSYAIDILAVGMQNEENAGIFKEENQAMVPIVLKRLKCLKEIPDLSTPAIQNCSKLSVKASSKSSSRHVRYSSGKIQKKKEEEGTPTSSKTKQADQQYTKKSLQEAIEKPAGEQTDNEKSEESKAEAKDGKESQGSATSSQWQEQLKIAKEAKSAKAKRYGYKKPTWCLWPLTVGSQQRSLVGYVTSLGQYQELLIYAFEHDALELIFYYTNVKMQKDPILALRGLEYLSALMCHKKFVTEFVARGGVQKLLEIPKQSTSSTGVSVCLYYLAYNDDAMERVCLLPQPMLTDLVKYALWLMDSGIHDSARCYSTLFFSLVFTFRAILDLFVSMDGLRRLINTVTVLSILRPEEARLMANDESFGMRQIIKHTLLALRRFFEAQLSIKADEIRRKIARNEGTLPPQPIPAYKAVPFSLNQHLENIQLLIENSEEISAWVPLLAFKKLGGIQLLFQIISFASSGWEGYSNRNEVVKSALEILLVLSVNPKVQLAFCQNVPLEADDSQSGISLLVRAAEGTLLKGDGEIQKVALQILCNCVCAPKAKSKNIPAVPRTFARPLKVEDVSHKMWNAVRMQNGIKVLLGLLNTKTPITEADAIRCLACKALCGLSRSDRIQQVLLKLIFTFSGQLQMLMREPVLPDKTNEHVKFCKYASELIEKITGKVLTEHGSPMAMLHTLKKADVVSQTHISYSEKELLQLIVNHLKTKGFNAAAKTLQKEANLTNTRQSEISKDAAFLSPVPSKKLKSSTSHHRTPETTLTYGDSTPGTPSIYRPEPEKLLDRLEMSKGSTSQNNNNNFQPTLDNIVRNYLREQHARCRNPVTTCPKFSLIRPHQCPEPHYKMHAPTNIMSRMFHRQKGNVLFLITELRFSSQSDVLLVFDVISYTYVFPCMFRSVGTIEDNEGMASFTCAKFLPDGDLILLGTKEGEVKMFNIFSGLEEAHYPCHMQPISSCEPSKDLNLLLTASPYCQPSAALWTFFNSPFFEKKLSFHGDNHVKFSTAQDQVIGTADYTAHIYDLTTGRLISTLADPRNINRYHKNIATFNNTDDLVLNDGCLWDVRSSKLLHKFDKFNDYVSGVFHPSGLEIIINSEIWDIRTFHLLDTCTSLDQCRSIFNNKGDVIYGVKHVPMDPQTEYIFGSNVLLGPYDYTFRTFDSYDFSVIATIDIKKMIFDLCPDNNDTLVAVIEGSSNAGEIESICRLYEVGRQRFIDGEDSDEEQAEDDGNDEINEDDEDEFDDAMDTLEDLFEKLSKPSTQCAAVTTHLDATSAPPQCALPFNNKRTCHGHPPGRAIPLWRLGCIAGCPHSDERMIAKLLISGYDNIRW